MFESIHRNRKMAWSPGAGVRAKMLTGVTVLIVDDDQETRQVLEATLRQEEAVVHCVANGAQAIEFLSHHKVSIVVTDIVMPGMTGIELAQSIRNLIPGLPVVAMSGHDRWRDEARESGCCAFFVKPFSYDGFLASIVRIAKFK